jgi:adsorption protein B
MIIADFVAYLLFFTKLLLAVLGVIFLVSGLDDLFIDLYYWGWALYRKIFVMRKHRRLTEEELRGAPEKPIAIMIPAWDESAVIRRMLEVTLQTIDYANYHVFVGTYPNDAATAREVETVRERHANVHRIVCPKDGPTSKSDCLNWVYQGIRVFEKENAIRFEAIVMNDSEDIVHPLYLKLFNYLIPRKDMVQLPVFPLETKWSDFTSGHYMDEFAENHTKDLVVRERLSGFVPGAGVGCGFSRKALETMAEDDNGLIFNLDSLTEDYDLGFRLKRYNFREIFVRHAVDREVMRRSFWTGKSRRVKVKEYIAVREYFPSNFKASVRQKARWVIGISLQGWSHLGWSGSPATKYMLFRDRKGLVTNFATVLGYLVVSVVVGFWIIQWAFPDSYRYPSIVERGSWLWYVILANGFLLAVRLIQRTTCVGRFYGWRQALLCPPHQVWANIINFAAAGRAVYFFSRYLLTGKLISWDKTAHAFPSEEELSTFRRRLGDLLLEKRFITVQQLDEALRRQSECHRPLGSILVELKMVQEDDLLQILGTQLRISTREIDPYSTPLELLRLVPRELAVRYSVYPFELDTEGRLHLAVEQPLKADEKLSLENSLGMSVDLVLATKSDIAFAIRRGYERLTKNTSQVLFGEELLERGLISAEQLSSALKMQRRSYTRLGDILVEKGKLSPEQLTRAVSLYRPEEERLGEFLVNEEFVTMEDVEEALQEQRVRFRYLGRVLKKQGVFGEDFHQEPIYAVP